jgi:membrane protein YdbS with pleckstrin-like domain
MLNLDFIIHFRPSPHPELIERNEFVVEDDKGIKRIETLKGMTNVILIIMGVASGSMIFIGILEPSIYIVIGVMIALLIVIIYYSITVYCDIALNVAKLREETEKTSLYIQKIAYRHDIG